MNVFVAEPSATEDVRLNSQALDHLMPMHIWINHTGHVVRTGRTLRKLCAPIDPVGMRVLELLEVRRPKQVKAVSELTELAGRRLSLVIREAPELPLKGVVVPLQGGEGAVLDLSVGISLSQAVRRFDLTLADFAPTDLAVEMLYLIEAKSAALQESRNLNDRLESAKSQAEERAQTDVLTGLKNRRAMDHALDGLTCPPAAEPFGVMHIDLDFFKAVNDSLGHAAGDLVLTEVARVLNDETRKDDIVSRVGGDEFVLILRDCDDPDLMRRIAERVIARLEEPVLFEGKPCCISASIGITSSNLYPKPEADQMLSDADEATYASKRGGRAQVTLFDALKRSEPDVRLS